MAPAKHKPAWLVSAQTARQLQQLDKVLLDAVQPQDLYLRVIAQHILTQKGKRLRPTLLLLAARFGDGEEDRVLQGAAALELLHIASLYHDDVLDRAPLRRNVPSASSRWGNGLATLAGTYLFARACVLFGSLGDGANRLASQACLDLCLGQLREVENAYNLELSEEDYLAILGRKTGTLFELPCRLGAEIGKVDPALADRLALYGHNLGLAFQLADDVLDLEGQVGMMGKAAGTDLRQGVYSLPVRRTLQRGGKCREQLLTLLSQVNLADSEIALVLSLIRESGALAEVRALARQYAVQAQQALADLPSGAARRSLYALAEYAVSRST